MSCHADVKALSDLNCLVVTSSSKFFLESSLSSKAWTSVLLEGGLWSHQSSALHSWRTVLHHARRRQGLTLRFCFWARFCSQQVKNLSNKPINCFFLSALSYTGQALKKEDTPSSTNGTAMSQYQASQHSSREHGGACEKLLTLGGCWEMKVNFL